MIVSHMMMPTTIAVARTMPITGRSDGVERGAVTASVQTGRRSGTALRHTGRRSRTARANGTVHCTQTARQEGNGGVGEPREEVGPTGRDARTAGGGRQDAQPMAHWLDAHLVGYVRPSPFEPCPRLR